MADETVGVLPSQRAQDIAEAQGVAYQDLATSKTQEANTVDTSYDAGKVGQTLQENTSYKPSTNYLDTATGTVAGQLQSLLSSDSPYIKQQEEKAKEQASSRGLLNTTMAAQSGRRAAIESALPIATKDAEINSQFQQARQTAEYGQQTMQSEAIVSSELVSQKAELEKRQSAINQAFQTQLQAADKKNETFLTDLQNSYNTSLQNLDAQIKRSMLELELTSEEARKLNESSTAIVENYQISIENMLTDPDFIALGKDAVNNAINQMQTLATNSIKFIAHSQKVDLDSLVDTYFSDLEILNK